MPRIGFEDKNCNRITQIACQTNHSIYNSKFQIVIEAPKHLQFKICQKKTKQKQKFIKENDVRQSAVIADIEI